MPTRFAAIRGTDQSVEYECRPAGDHSDRTIHVTADKRTVVAFFKTRADRGHERLTRLEKIIDQFNPIPAGPDGGYWRSSISWPLAIVACRERGLGLLFPTYPREFFFAEGPWSGKEKRAGLFFGQTAEGLPSRESLPPSEQGDFQNFLHISVKLSRAIRQLHRTGLAHPDLCGRNILIDPPRSGCLILNDVETIVLPGDPAQMQGSRDYIAPEMLDTGDPYSADQARTAATALTNRHSLAVLIYQMLLKRHPLRGPKLHSTKPEEDEHLTMGANALWIEHPEDDSNRPSDLQVTSRHLGPQLAHCFEEAFVHGLKQPYHRPRPEEWEAALVKTSDRLIPCPNPDCREKWSIVGTDTRSIECIWCGTGIPGSFPLLHLQSRTSPGEWQDDLQVAVRDKLSIFPWHAFDHVRPGEHAPRTPVGLCTYHRGTWLFVNQGLDALQSPSGKPVPLGSAVALDDGAEFRLSTDGGGRRARVQFVNMPETPTAIIQTGGE